MWTMKKNVFAFGSNDLRKCQGTLKLLWEFVKNVDNDKKCVLGDDLRKCQGTLNTLREFLKNVDNDKKCVLGRCRRRQLQLDGRNLICHTVSSPRENKSETFEKNFHCCFLARKLFYFQINIARIANAVQVTI